MKKKILSLILVLVLIMAPFSIFLNVYATDITLTNLTITVDANNKVTDVTHEENNQTIHGGKIEIKDVNADEDDDVYSVANSDTFKAYKIIDTYYNATTNEISYGFTTAFQSFLNDSSYANDNTVHGLTVNGYLALTSDEYGYNGNAASGDIETTSTLNILVSKYATYIRKNNVSGSPMTNSLDESDCVIATLDNVIPGSYVILPSSLTTRNVADEGYYWFRSYTYGVMVANVFFSNDNGDWALTDATIYSKSIEKGQYIDVYPFPMEMFEAEMTEEEEEALWARIENPASVSSGSVISFYLEDSTEYIPTNTHSSIKNNQNVMDLFNYSTITLPSGLTFTDTFYKGNGSALQKSGNNYYYNTQEEGDILVITKIDSNTIYYYNNDAKAFGNINISNSYNFTAGTNYTVTLKEYYLKDPYVDIGANVTKAMVEDAFDTNSQNYSSSQSVTIRQALGVNIIERSVVFSGVRVVNTDSSNNTLSGAVFQAYSDSNCTAGNEIGQPFTVQTVGNDTYGQFVGINNYDTVYLKQIKAPSGYRLIDTPIEVDPTSLTLGQDGYYEVTAVNQPILALPFTGGSGTVIYTVIGLIIVAGAGIFLVLYKKNKKDNNEKK